MENKVYTNLRKWISLLISIALYYMIHEGAHVLIASVFGVFESVRILGLGVQVIANVEVLTDVQIGLFCIIGSVSTLLVGYILVALASKIVANTNRLSKAVGFYTTICLLLLDPIYLSILYRFVGGGDMNGIVLFGISEMLIQLVAGIFCILNVFVVVYYIYPLYKKGFNK